MQFIGVSLLSFTVDLLGCLNWQKILRENDTASLKQHLHQLMRVDGEEIVKVDGRCCVQKTKYPTHSMYQCCVFVLFLRAPYSCTKFIRTPKLQSFHSLSF